MSLPPADPSPTPPPARPVPPVSPFAPARTPLVFVGGALGIASTVVGLLIFLTACAGYDAAMKLALLPVGLGAVGLGLVVVGGTFQKHVHLPDTQVLASLFLAVFGIAGGLLEMAAWLGWKILY